MNICFPENTPQSPTTHVEHTLTNALFSTSRSVFGSAACIDNVYRYFDDITLLWHFAIFTIHMVVNIFIDI